MEPTALPAGYAEHDAPPELRSAVVCFWTRRERARAVGTERVLPDGCVDIVLSLGGDRDGVTAALAVGAMTRPLLLDGPMPPLYIGVRFRPGYAFTAFGVPGSELVDATVPFSFLARDAAPWMDAISAARTDRGRLAAMMAGVARRLAPAAAPPAAVREAVRRISAAHGNLRITALAPALGVSRQELSRQFARHVGVPPKMFARVMRAQAAVARADAARAAYPRIDWSALAYELGYYDQPHFVDDFRAITGLTPGEWMKSGV